MINVLGILVHFWASYHLRLYIWKKIRMIVMLANSWLIHLIISYYNRHNCLAYGQAESVRLESIKTHNVQVQLLCLY